MGVPLRSGQARGPRICNSTVFNRLDYPMIRSGISPLDERLGGVAPGRIHILTGSLGTGKTSACLHFLDVALREGERAAMVTLDRGSDLKSLAQYLGIDIDTPLRDGRLQLVRFRSEFPRRYAHSPSPESVFEDLRKMIGATPVARIAIDPLDPFLGEGGPVTAGGGALTSFLEGFGATSLLTHTMDPTEKPDRRLDLVISRSAAMIRLERGHANVNYLGVVRARFPDVPSAPLAFQIRRGAGIERYNGARSGEILANPSPSRGSRKLLVLHTGSALPAEVVALFRRDYDATVRPAPAIGASLELPSDGVGGVDGIVVAVTHESVHAALSLVARLEERTQPVPIIVAARFNLRSFDRARLLRAGADEILATDMGTPEFLQRLAAAMSRPHATRVTPRYADTLILQPEKAGSFKPLAQEEFAAALASHVAHDHPTQYTVVTLTPDFVSDDRGSGPNVMRDLAELVLRSSRASSGDLTAIIEGKVAVYLHGTRQDDAAVFIERVRASWKARRGGSIKVESTSYPSGEPMLRTRMEPGRTR